MVSTRGRLQRSSNDREEETQNESKNNNGGGSSGYEQFRDQRIKENMQRMHKLGIFDLSSKLKATTKRPTRNPSSRKKPTVLPSSDPPRRSSRLQSVTPVSYSEFSFPKEVISVKKMKNVEIHIKEGLKPEIYTEEHEKLLNDYKTTWTLFMDGYDDDGQRIYDQIDGKSCHQCRQKTLGHHTECSKCKLVRGQLCGDCLYMRYGENVMEANENPSWICPACRDICNCSRCRRDKGWEPTGSIYRKVVNLGFKSVAHYLIQTRRFQTNREEPTSENLLSASRSSSFSDRETESSDGISEPQLDDSKDEMEEVSKHDDSNCDDDNDGGEDADE